MCIRDRIRSTLAQAVHAFFDEEGFNYVHSPIITTSDCEGAGEMFRVTSLDGKDPVSYTHLTLPTKA